MAKKRNVYIPFSDLTCDFSNEGRLKNRFTNHDWYIQKNTHDVSGDELFYVVGRETSKDPDYLYHRTPDEAVIKILKNINANVIPVFFDIGLPKDVCIEDSDLSEPERLSIGEFFRDFLNTSRADARCIAKERLNTYPEDDIIMTKDPAIYQDRIKEKKLTVLLTDDPKQKSVEDYGIAVNPESPYATAYVTETLRMFDKRMERKNIIENESLSYLFPDTKEEVEAEWLKTHDPDPALACVGYLKDLTNVPDIVRKKIERDRRKEEEEERI
jgi:hypothetical protein